MMLLTNPEIYESARVVEQYSGEPMLLKGEKSILARHPGLFKNKRVLDIGVGAGRTTPAFSKEAAEYQALDYSEAMVKACCKRFKDQPNIRFFQDDARTLAQCPDHYFDVAFFSFNGIDSVPFEERKDVLAAVFSAIKPGGQFAFSFHNAGYLHRLYRYNWSKNPFKWLANIRRRKMLLRLNGEAQQYEGRDHFYLRDGGDNFQTLICYTRPSTQIEMLRAAGFAVEESYAALEGGALETNALDNATVPWIYLLCSKH